MITPLFTVLTVAVILQTNFATAALQPPACSVNCTIAVLENAGCELTNITNCLCRNETLQYELAACVISSCDIADQMVATEISQEEICLGIPYPSRQAEIVRAEIILAAFTFPIVGLRFISRIWVAHRIWWDDWMVLLATVLMVPNTAIPIYTAYHGFGVHVWNVRPQDQVILQQLYYVAQIFYALIQNIAKFSILFLYLRIFPTPRFQQVVKMSIVVIVCHTIAFTLGVTMQCFPLDSLWDNTVPAKCIDIHIFAIWGAALSIFYDIVIMMLPISELKGLNLTLRKRIALCFMFALGSFACVTSMVRLKYLKDFYPTIDGSWDSTDAVIWSDIETYTAVICSCLMCIRPLLVKCFPALFPSHNTSNSNSNSNPVNSKLSAGQSVSSGLRSPWKMKSTRFSGNLRSLGSGNLSSGLGSGTIEGYGDQEVFVIQRLNDREGERNIELEERGVMPSTPRTLETQSSAESLGFHHRREVE